MSITMYIPIAVIVLSNVFYHICAKSTPDDLDPFASLTLTYFVGAVISAATYYVIHRGGNIFMELKASNWTSWILGVAIVGLELGNIFMYKAGWDISTGQIVQSSILAVALIAVGFFAYQEQITLTKAAGIVICMVGLYFINK